MKNVSMKIMVAGTLTVLAVCVATGCGSSDTINGDIHIESENSEIQNNEIENSEIQNNELQNNEMQNSEIENGGIENNKDVTAFSDALNRLLFENILPDGRAVVFDEEYFMDDNSFAIYDYDGDSPSTDTLTADFFEILCLNDSDGSSSGKIFTFEMSE